MDEIKKRFSQLEHKGISVKAAFAEMVGVATFVLIGTMVSVNAGFFHQDPGFMVETAIVAAAFGLAIAVSMYMIGHTSGAHINPAVTVGMVASGITTPIQAVGNIVGQCVGAFLAAILLFILVPHHIRKGQHLGSDILPEGSHIIQAFLAEMIGMFICQLVILETVHHAKSKAGNMAPMVIGSTFAVVILAIAPISGAGLNPARSLGPALLSGTLKHLWLWILAPICGALLAAPVHLFSITDIDSITKAHANSGDASDPLLPTTVGGTN